MGLTSYDYTVLYRVFSRLLKSKLGLTLIDLNGNGKPPTPPFAALDIISPKIPNNFLEDDSVFEAVESFFIFTTS